MWTCCLALFGAQFMFENSYLNSAACVIRTSSKLWNTLNNPNLWNRCLVSVVQSWIQTWKSFGSVGTSSPCIFMIHYCLQVWPELICYLALQFWSYEEKSSVTQRAWSPTKVVSLHGIVVAEAEQRFVLYHWQCIKEDAWVQIMGNTLWIRLCFSKPLNVARFEMPDGRIFTWKRMRIFTDRNVKKITTIPATRVWPTVNPKPWIEKFML